MLRLFPRYDRGDLASRLFHKAVRRQWSAEDVDWEAPAGLTPRQALALTNVITPVYQGEQAAMNGAALALPQLIARGETTAQLYLSTFLLDEARHFDALTRLYDRFGNRPLALRAMPEMLRYHVRLSAGDRVDWLFGILISDLFARAFYLTFAQVQPGALFGQLSARILVDESRHQAFAHAYLKNAVPLLSDARRQGLVAMRDDLVAAMEAMCRRLTADTDALGIDGQAFLAELVRQIDRHAVALGLGSARAGGGPGDPPAGGDWPSRLAHLRARNLAESGGRLWPEAGPESPASPGGRLIAADTPDLTAADLRLLVGPARRVFGAAHPLRAAATCAACALVRLCHRAVLRPAATVWT